VVHPLPSGAIASDVVRIPVVVVMVYVGVLDPSRLTVNAAMPPLLVLDAQLKISVPDVAAGVDSSVRLLQFAEVAKFKGGIIVAGKDWEMAAYTIPLTLAAAATSPIRR
jgi:hypothetical protein